MILSLKVRLVGLPMKQFGMHGHAAKALLNVQVVHSTTLKRSNAPKGWLKPRGPEGQQGPEPLPLNESP